MNHHPSKNNKNANKVQDVDEQSKRVQHRIESIDSFNSRHDHDDESVTFGMIDKSDPPSLTHYSLTKLSPSLAAAMLSLPWPPVTESKKIENENNANTVNDVIVNTAPTTPVPSKVMNKVSIMKKMLSLKPSLIPRMPSSFQRKQSKSTKLMVDQGTNTGNKDPVYHPFKIPKFDEVHTNWPGFDHEPVPDWEEKYLKAKPFPKELSSEKSTETVKEPSTTFKFSKVLSNYIKKGESAAAASQKVLKFRESKSEVRKKGSSSAVTQNKPQRRIKIESVGRTR